MTEEMKNCPFCGGSARTQVDIASMGNGSDRIDFSIVCEKCGTRKVVNLYVRGCSTFADVERAIEHATCVWNRRVSDE